MEIERGSDSGAKDRCLMQTDKQMTDAPVSQSSLDRVSQTHQVGGCHLLVTLQDCLPDLLNDEEGLRKLIVEAAEATGATVLQVCSQRFSPQGVTALAVLAESHASLHTYPEVNAVFFDCFTCGASCDPEISVPVLEKALQPKSMLKQVVMRELA